MTRKELSKTQQEVLDLMSKGWQLGMSHSFGGWAWLQEGGIGRGGKSKDVRSSTVNALFKTGFIKQDRRDGLTMLFKLTEKGWSA